MSYDWQMKVFVLHVSFSVALDSVNTTSSFISSFLVEELWVIWLVVKRRLQNDFRIRCSLFGFPPGERSCKTWAHVRGDSEGCHVRNFLCCIHHSVFLLFVFVFGFTNVKKSPELDISAVLQLCPVARLIHFLPLRWFRVESLSHWC